MTLRLQDVRIEPPAPLVPFVAEPTVIESSDDIAAEAVAKAEVHAFLYRAGKTDRTYDLVERLVGQLVDRHSLHSPVIRYARELRGQR